MKTVSRINDVTRSGVKKSTKCGIVVNAKAFDMLARQYSDPIKAILQELGANAADSHIRAGKQDVPFSVKLPNTLDPHLRIRDYGVGMTEDVVYDVYINYMKSDKTNTNSETGCFGIGSKTPLSYADQFNITTYNDGVMTMYALVKNEEGVPELNEFGSWSTEENNGVEISFSVKEDDFDKFAERASKVYSYFKTRPDVSGNGCFEFTDLSNVILEGDTWKILKRSYATDNMVIMGNVAYPIDDYQFEHGSKYREFLYNTMCIEVPIGDLNVTPSREALEYSDHTIKGIKNAIDKVMEEIDFSVSEKFLKCESWWQAKRVQREICSEIQGIGDLSSLEEFNGRSLKEYPELWVKRVFRVDGNKVKARNEEYKKRIETRSNTKVVLQDTQTKFDKNCRYLADQEEVIVYLVNLEDDDQTYEDIQDILGVCDSDEVLMLSSELPEAPKSPSTGSTSGYTRKKTTSVRSFCPNGNSHYGNRYEARWWTEAEVDFSDDTQNRLYVNWFNYDVTDQNGDSIDVRQLHKEMEELGIEMPNLYGMKKNQINRVSKKDHWMALEDWAKMAFKVYIEDNDVEEILQLNSSLKCKDWILPLVRMLGNADVSISEDCDLGKLLKKVGAEKSSKNAEKILAISRRLKYNVGNDDDSVGEEIEKLAEQCENKYTFLMHWIDSSYISRTDVDIVKNLIKMVEAFDLCN